jgi:hypothetical protein
VWALTQRVGTRLRALGRDTFTQLAPLARARDHLYISYSGSPSTFLG